ncbi:hypothetical protein [Rhabdothermincola salaria]|uniref:hypothetical protein n=1 Tax=Rhabdothermincola salaria TaxID=2903142 RepID=UPI001E2B4407|nr:hypothetical protein [Rhabdothermincola salaria]MCD9624619.1 hypothetical protein [Rhabdothermincola salaria]
MSEGDDVDRPPGAPPRRLPGGCLLVGLVVGALMAFTVIVVVSLTLIGVIGGESSADERREILAEIVEETGIATSSQDIDEPPQRDVRLGLCETDGDGAMVTSGMLINPEDAPVDYVLTVTFHEGSGSEMGAEVARREVVVDDVPAGETVEWTASSQAPASADFSCRVVRIERDDAG